MKRGIVGRLVSCEVMRGDTKVREDCEVMACQAAGEYGNWKLLVATHDGHLMPMTPSDCVLVGGSEAPYR